MTPAATFYLLIELAASPGLPMPAPRPVGPMEQADCKAVQLAIEAAAVPAIASVACREVRVWAACPSPGKPWEGSACPVWDSLTVGSYPASK